jgi:multicomponent Na+:H+ antiporter subunit F
MADVLLAAAGIILVTVALGLVPIVRGASATDNILAVQLFGTGGVAVLLLLGAVSGAEAIVDVALTLALLSAFVSVAFVKSYPTAPSDITPSERDV